MEAVQIQVFDSALRSRASAQGDAVIRHFVTTLRATVDLRAQAAGAYELAAWRRATSGGSSRRRCSGHSTLATKRLLVAYPGNLVPRSVLLSAIIDSHSGLLKLNRGSRYVEADAEEPDPPSATPTAQASYQLASDRV